MKPLLFFLLLISVPVHSQVNFAAKHNKIVWENVFISDEANIAEYLAKHPRLKFEASSGPILKGRGSMLKNSCAGATGEAAGEVSFNFEIQVSGSKYRVTITNIAFGTNRVNAEKILLEKGALKAGESTKHNLYCLEGFFNRLFTLGDVFKNKS